MSNLHTISGTLNIGSGQIYDIILSDTSGNPTIFNRNKLDIDFIVSGVGSNNLYFDASKGRLGVNTANPDSTLHIVTDCAYDGLKVENETNCTTGVRILFIHNSQTLPQTGSYPVTIDLAGRDTSYSPINYAQIQSRILNPTALQTSGEILFTVDHTGVNKQVFRSSLVETVLGGMNNIRGYLYNVVGYNNISSGVSYVILGNNNETVHSTGIVIGNNIYATGNKILVISNNTDVLGSDNIAFSVDSLVSGLSNISIGSNTTILGNSSIILGNNVYGSGNNLLGLLTNSIISGQSGIGFGTNISNIGNNNIYVGNIVSTSGNNDIVIGSNTAITGNNNVVYGNGSKVLGNNVISVGRNNIVTNITSGIYIGSDVNLNNSIKSVIIGLGTTTNSGLNDSILLGINNSTLQSSPTGLVVVGQNNIVSNIRQSLIVGNNNNLSGNLANNIVVGPRNNVPLNSNNNLIFGILNNTSGIVISTDGSVVGSDLKAAGDAMSNTNVFGINNWITNASGALVVGNKSRVSGLNTNSLGSYTNLNGNDIYNLGNSNFVVGNNNGILGSYSDIVGTNSLSINTSRGRNQVFGSGNIVVGPNEVIVSGIVLGSDNELYGPLNSVYGNNNTVGLSRYPCRVSGNNIVMLGNIDDFKGGDKILIALFSPSSQSSPCYVRTILDGTDPISNQSLGVIKNNTNNNNTTTLFVDSAINQTNTINYYVKETFDDIIHGGGDPCSVCFSDAYDGYDVGYVIPFQDGSDSNLILSPLYGNYNVIIGNNNKYTHHSGLVLGYNNNISGVNHIVIGNNIRGYYNNTVQIGSTNINKLVFDNEKVVFNTGALQQNIYFNSSNAGGTNNARVMTINLSTNRVGVNTTTPRSTLDVSGVLTTDRLRVNLSAVPGYSLIADASGEATWQFPVNLSGQNSGLLFKVTDKIGSGVNEMIFDRTSRSLNYLRSNRATNTSNSFILQPGDDDERILIISPSGMFLNNSSSDYGYDFVIKGSGFQNAIAEDNSVYLLKTMIKDNAIRVYNITGVSGSLNNLSIFSGVKLPVSLTGTALSINSNGNLLSRSFDRHSLLFSSSSYATTGNNSLRYYAAEQALTIGATGDPPSTAENALQQGASNLFSNIILGSKNNIDTVFNNAGLGNHFFIVVSNNNGSTKKGMQYAVDSGCLGVNVNKQDTDWRVSNSNQTLRWFDAGSLVVDGKIRARSLQLTPDGKTLPGENSVNKYLKILDNAGNVGLDVINLDYQFTGIYPISVETSTINQRVAVSIAPRDNNGVNLGPSQNGNVLVWDGAKWALNNGFRFPQSIGGTNNTPGMEFGNDLSINSCRNNHVFGGGSFVRNSSSWRGSSQLSTFYLRGRTLGDVQSELTADWNKNLATSGNINNTISLQYLSNDSLASPVDHNRTFVWNYIVNYSAVFSNNTVNGYEAVAGEVKGSVLSYRNSNGTRTTTKVGSDTITKRNTSNVDYSILNPISVDIINDGNSINVQRLGIMANGRPSWNALWSVVVDINQVFVPSGINFGNDSIA